MSVAADLRMMPKRTRLEHLMTHALIIEDNMAIAAALEDRLAELGFDSFEQSWTEEDAVAAADQHVPDLVIVGSSLIHGSPIEAARRIAEKHEVTTLLATADGASTLRKLPASATLHGPFMLRELEQAVDFAKCHGRSGPLAQMA
jgi:DNA-binding response OmpR family regulator